MMQRMRFVGLAAVGMAVVLLAGCQVDSKKSGDGKDVKIATPFGGMRVKTGDSAVQDEIGLSAYPGARPEKHEDKDGGSADVKMAFGSFQMRVTAMSFRTDDPPEKVEAFYRDGMKRYGDVIVCRSDGSDEDARTAGGLTCDDRKGVHLKVNERAGRSKVELKAGSEQHQHIVSIDPDGGGTKFGLVALDLPGKFYSDDGEDDGKQ
jgi:hypothetical protein